MSEIAAMGLFLIASLAVGWLLSRKFHSESRALESLIRIPVNLAWILAGLFTILGGFYATGALILILWSYFFFSNTRRVREGELSMKPGGWRRRVANWNPYNRSG